jgi:hypothetical protein
VFFQVRNVPISLNNVFFRPFNNLFRSFSVSNVLSYKSLNHCLRSSVRILSIQTLTMVCVFQSSKSLLYKSLNNIRSFSKSECLLFSYKSLNNGFWFFSKFNCSSRIAQQYLGPKFEFFFSINRSTTCP